MCRPFQVLVKSTAFPRPEAPTRRGRATAANCSISEAEARSLQRQMLAVDVSTTGDFKNSVPRQLFEGPSSPLIRSGVTT